MVTKYHCDGCGQVMGYDDEERAAILRNQEKVGDLCAECQAEVQSFLKKRKKK